MRKVAYVVLMLSLSMGCSYVRSQQRIDLAPFAETTISLAMDVEYGFTETTRAVNLRPYWQDSVVVAHRAEWNKVRVLLKGIVAYSVEITTLGNSTLPGPERCHMLAEFLGLLVRPVVSRPGAYVHLSTARLDSVLGDIRMQKTLLDGLTAAQPIIDEVARVADDIFDGVRESLDATARHVMKRIDEDNADVELYGRLIREAHYRAFRSIVLLGRYRTGDASALHELFENDPQLRELAKSDDGLTLGEIGAIEKRLFDKAAAAREFNEQIQPDVERYRARQQELADLYASATHQLRRARTTIIVWSRAHRNLAQGIADPAKVNLFDITKKAIDTAL